MQVYDIYDFAFATYAEAAERNVVGGQSSNTLHVNFWPRPLNKVRSSLVCLCVCNGSMRE